MKGGERVIFSRLQSRSSMPQGIAPDRAKFRLQRVFKAFERVYAVNNRTSYRAVFLVD